jgi:NADPH-dependent ferric siderophore reductase
MVLLGGFVAISLSTLHWHADHIMSSVQHITRTGQFLTSVAAVDTVSPRMRRITLSADAIAERDWPLACDIAIVLAGEDGREVRRRYTVRTTSGPSLVVDAVLHGHGPGSTWASGVTVGDEVTFFGPRGEIPVTGADWVLALTDESGLPAVAAVAEALGREISVIAEIANENEHYPLPLNASVRWLPRGHRPAGFAELLTAALEDVTPAEGTRHAYVIGESRAIVALRDRLSRFGLSRADVYAKGYWNLNSRSAR